MSGLQSPIFVIDGLDVSVHPTLEAAILELEGVDVDDGVYRLFDADGRRITLRTEGVHRSRWTIDIGTVHFDGAETIPTGAEELTSLLADHLDAIGIRCEPDADLATTLRLVCERHKH